MKIGIDIDDVIYPWYTQAHKVIEAQGGTGGVVPKTWYPYIEYGMSRDEWRDRLGAATIDGSLFLQGEPIEGAVEAVELLGRIGHVHFITSRGYLPSGAVAQAQTVLWLAGHGFAYDALTFTESKGDVDIDFMVDDMIRNLEACRNRGAAGALINRSWNADDETDFPRFDSLLDFAHHLEAVNAN